MLVNSGLLKLLALELGYWATLEIGLVEDDLAEDPTLTLTDVEAAEAGWIGYSRGTIGAFPPPTVATIGIASTSTGTVQFQNNQTMPATFYGWFAVDVSAGLLIAFVNFGLNEIPPENSILINIQVIDNDGGD